jgi:uncharacterized protein YwqG
VVGLFLVLLVGSVVLAARRPLAGVPFAAATVALGALLLRFLSKREGEEAARENERLRGVASPVGDAWRKLLAHEGLGRLVPLLGGRVRQAVRAKTHRIEGVPVAGGSRIGGRPDLPADLPWPEHDGQPLMFLAQLDLAEVHSVHPSGELPAAGHLWFFYSLAQPWGFDPKDAGGSRVFYRPPGTRLLPAEAPEGLPPDGRFKPCSVSFEAFEDIPEPEDDDPQLGGLDENEADRYVELRNYISSGGQESSHKLLGFANPVQGAMELECQLVTNGVYCGDESGYRGPRAEALRDGLTEWRLLLQLDSDGEAGMMWGDLGRLYFWIRESDLRERRFESTWTILQCH